MFFSDHHRGSMGGLATLYYKSKMDRRHVRFRQMLITSAWFVTRWRNLAVLKRAACH